MVKDMQLPFTCHKLGSHQAAKLEIILNPPNCGARIIGDKMTGLSDLAYSPLLCS
jgi:hypothetical protein